MLDSRELERVPVDADTVAALMANADRHILSAASVVASDPEGAYVLAYDAARKSSTALLAHQGLRPTTRGGHIGVVEAISAQFPGVRGLRSLDMLRQRRHQAEYPDPRGYDPITVEEVEEALGIARDAVAAVRRLLEAPQLGLF